MPSKTAPQQTALKNSLSTEDLFNQDFGLEAPFHLTLAQGDEVKVEQVLRYMPGKRLACKVIKDKEVFFAKIFSAQAEQQFKKELSGIQLLQENNIPSAKLVCSQNEKNGFILFQQWLSGKAFKIENNIHEGLRFLGKLHHRGLIHTDIHSNNIMVVDKTLTLLDAGAVEMAETQKSITANLTLFLAQTPPTQHPHFISALASYENALGRAVDLEGLPKKIKRSWQKRQKNYLAKIFRSCTDIVQYNRNNIHILCKRKYWQGDFVHRLQAPELLQQNSQIIKAGNSAKVYSIVVEGKKYAVKEYFNKDVFRSVRRALQQSRAARSWRFAHAFAFAGINVPEPVALIEKKRGPFVQQSWLISEHLEGTSLLDYWLNNTPEGLPLEQVKQLFFVMSYSNISHGDMKATNLIYNSNDGVILIDFDGSKYCMSEKKAARLIEKDRRRLLKNWPNLKLDSMLQNSNIKTDVV